MTTANTIAAPTKSKHGTPTQPKRIPWNLASRASELEAEPLAKYLDLICDGSPEAIAVAAAIHPDARKDASDIRDCRAALQLLADASDPGPRRKLGKLQGKLETVRDEIARLEVVATELENELRVAERTLPSRHQFRRRITIICANSIVRQALKTELEAAGV